MNVINKVFFLSPLPLPLDDNELFHLDVESDSDADRAAQVGLGDERGVRGWVMFASPQIEAW